MQMYVYGHAFDVRVLKFDGAFGPEGCGIALLGNAYKVSVTGLAFCVVWLGKQSAE